MSRRTGDTIAISGDYQYKALHEGNAIQRFWHYNKQLTIARYLPPQPGEVVLDVGCGSGVVASFLAKSGARVIGIDANADAIAFARRTFRHENLSFQLGLVDATLHLDQPVDKIYCLEVIEHIYPEQARDMLRICRDCLRPGGLLYLTTPNYHSLWPIIEWVMDALRLAPQLAEHQHVARYNRQSLRWLCESAGFAIERLETTCFLAPWLAPICWNLALRTNTVETGSALGCILVGIVRKGTA